VTTSTTSSASVGVRTALAGHTALVTGASSGIGRHFALLLARHGAEVVAAARRTAQLDAVVDGIREEGGTARSVALDVRDPASVEAAFAGPAIDIVVNNAGVALTRAALDTSEDEWQQVLDTNLSGALPRVARWSPPSDPASS
jgi:NADP-dependent 3-hydroxy acid dehydrogenase YdfG